MATRMSFKKETKHTVVYEVPNAYDGEPVPATSVYVSKDWLRTRRTADGKWPAVLELEMAVPTGSQATGSQS